MEITDEKVRALQEAWKRLRGETLTATKAKRRLEEAASKGCPLLDDCSKCEKVANCPILSET